MDIDSIIRKILEKNLSMYEQERLTVLNALMGNMDIMMNKADEWFGKNIPEEYSRVIRSLFSLSAFLLEKKSNRFEIGKIDNHNEINITLFIKQVVSELCNILDFGEMKINPSSPKHDLIVKSSEVLLKEALYNIFFSVYPFMKEDSSCLINLNENSLNISVEIIFDKLNPIFPGASEIKKNIYSYIHGGVEKIGIGIDSAISGLRTSGSIVKVNELQLKDRFSLSILFPAIEFYKEIESIRSEEHGTHTSRYSGEIFLMINDPFMKLFLTDVLHEYGYTIKSITYNEVMSDIPVDMIKAFVIEYHEEYFKSPDIVKSLSAINSKKILIYNEGHTPVLSEHGTCLNVIKPFNVEDIIEMIEQV